MKAPLSGLVAKGANPAKHKWQRTERMIPGAVLRLHACIACKPAHVKAYEMEVSNADAFQGLLEYQMRNQHV